MHGKLSMTYWFCREAFATLQMALPEMDKPKELVRLDYFTHPD